jgi:hypothetical protein
MLSYGSNADKIREFIKNVYVEKRYAGGTISDKPPRDLQVNMSLNQFLCRLYVKELYSVCWFCF